MRVFLVVVSLAVFMIQSDPLQFSSLCSWPCYYVSRLTKPMLIFKLRSLLVVAFFFSSTPMNTMSLSLSSRKYDLVIYGATGFTGQLAAEYVHKQYPNLNVALAGRNKAKLESVRSEIFGPSSNVPIVVADAVQDPASLQELVASTKVIANYAGTPFIDKALPIVEACAKHGTCYTDITAEVPFERVSYDRYHKEAEKSGALILHACGYDSVPSDLGAMLAADAMKVKYGCDCSSIELVAGIGSGAFSGGTIHTAMAYLFGSKDMPGMKECRVRGKYSLDPEGASAGPDTADSVTFMSYDSIAKAYVIPFMMASVNAPVVRKSNALFGYRYGKNCTYREVQMVPSWIIGFTVMLGFGVFAALIAVPPTRWLLLTYVLPKPGEGPTRQQQDNGFFESYIYAVGANDKKPVVKAFVKSGDAGDPGYKATARISIEASLCMVLERDSCAKGGVLTPATGLGKTLVDRLSRSGMILGVDTASA